MLPAGGSCLLGSINLAEFATPHGFNFDDFRKTVHIATIGLNEVLDEGVPRIYFRSRVCKSRGSDPDQKFQ